MADTKVEYSEENRFPFHSSRDGNITICFDDHEDMYELDFIWNKIVEKHPSLDARPFYDRIRDIHNMKTESRKVQCVKDACDKLLKNIRECLSDEDFIHQLHDRWGFGID